MILPLLLMLSSPAVMPPYPPECPEGPVNAVFPNYADTTGPQPIEYYLNVYRSPWYPSTANWVPWATFARMWSQDRAQHTAFLIATCGIVGPGVVTEDPGAYLPGNLVWVDIRKRLYNDGFKE